MKNKFVALSTLVPMAFAISFSGAEPITDSEEFAELGNLIQDTQYSGQKTKEDSTKALEQFKKLESRYKDVVSDRNAIQANLSSKTDELEQTKELHKKQLQAAQEKHKKQLQETQDLHRRKTDALTKQLSTEKEKAQRTEEQRRLTQSNLDKLKEQNKQAQAALDAKTREHEQTTAQLEAEKREKAKAQANLKAKDIQVQNFKNERDVAVTKKREQDDQLKKLERKHNAAKEEQKRHEEEIKALSQEMANMRTKIGDALRIVDSNVESIKEEVKKIESSAGVSEAVKESCVNISVTLENIDESLEEEKKDLLQLRKDAAELEAKKAQDEADADTAATYGE